MRTVCYSIVGRCLTLTLILSAFVSVCIAADDDAEIQSRIESVGRLVNSSSAAEKVAESGKPEALAMQREARKLQQAAEDAHGAGEFAEAKELLGQATRKMFEAARLAENGDNRIRKQQHDFDQRLASVDALLEAYERIGHEKQIDKQPVEETRAAINAKVDAAQALRREQKLEQARATLDEAYLSAKVAIEQLRGGDTLVRHLNFASDEEEYVYELDRNDTHLMLVDILLREKLSNAKSGMEKLVAQFMDKAEQLRSRAEEQAAGGHYGPAVETLELSTKEIVRAIRSAGVYIPG